MNRTLADSATAAIVVLVVTIAALVGAGGGVAAAPGGPGGGGSDVIVVSENESIQAAEDQADSGDTIEVEPGVYNETVRVDTADLTITAADPSNPPTVRFTPAEPKSNATFEVIANGVVLSNLTIERVGHPDRTGDNVTAAVAIVPVDSDRPTCLFCTDVTRDVVVEGTEIAGEFDAEDANAGVAISDGIEFAGLDIAGDAENVTLRDNDVHGFAGGIVFAAEYGGTISDVDVAGNAIHDNLATRNGTPHGTGVAFVRNTSEGSLSGISVTDNDIADNHYGVRIAGNETNATLVDVDASAIAVNRNDVVNNSEFGALNNGTNVLDAENNWWGDADGPSGEGSGDGDAVSTGVDFDPWLTEPVT